MSGSLIKSLCDLLSYAHLFIYWSFWTQKKISNSGVDSELMHPMASKENTREVFERLRMTTRASTSWRWEKDSFFIAELVWQTTACWLFRYVRLFFIVLYVLYVIVAWVAVICNLELNKGKVSFCYSIFLVVFYWGEIIKAF